MQPIYFLPQTSRSTLAPGNLLAKSLLELRGLADVFADVSAVDRDCVVCELSGRGPGNLPGCVLCYQTPAGAVPRRIGYYPNEQQWHGPFSAADGAPGFWIGIDPADRPVPEDMARSRQYNGYRMELADGQQWLIPVIRRPDDTTELPEDLGWDSSGAFVRTIKQPYRRYWEESAKVAERFFGVGFDDDDFSIEWALSAAVDAVGLNYRFGRAEQSILHAIDSRTWATVLGFSIDLPKVDEALRHRSPEQKKRDEPLTEQPADSPNSAPGDAACSTATGQAAGTCT